MKASIKVRDSGQEPLVRAKIPLSVGGLPISTGVTVGSSHEFGLHISSEFTSGPSCRLGFMPNDSQKPLRLTLRAGLGPWASPNASSIIVSIHLSLPLQQQHYQQLKPTLSFSIKPRSGDFVLCKPLKRIQLRKSHSVDDLPKPVSVAELAKVFERTKKYVQKSEENEEDDDWVLPESGKTRLKSANGASPPPFFKGWSLVAHSSLPLGKRVAAGFRWRMGVREDLIQCFASDPRKLFSRCSLPVLTLDKVSLVFRDEEVACKKERSRSKVVAAEACSWIEENDELNKVAVMCSSMRRQLHLVYSENQMLRSTMEEMKANFSGRKNSQPNPEVEYSSKPQVNSAVSSSVSSRQEDQKVAKAARQEEQKAKAVRQEDQAHKVKTAAAAQQPQQKEDQDSSPSRAADIAKELQKAIVASKSS